MSSWPTSTTRAARRWPRRWGARSTTSTSRTPRRGRLSVAAAGGVDIVYLNAGVTTLPPGTGLSDAAANHITRLSDRDYRRIMAINVDGVGVRRPCRGAEHGRAGRRRDRGDVVPRRADRLPARSDLRRHEARRDRAGAQPRTAARSARHQRPRRLPRHHRHRHRRRHGQARAAGSRLPDHPARAHRRGRPHRHPLAGHRVRAGSARPVATRSRSSSATSPDPGTPTDHGSCRRRPRWPAAPDRDGPRA